MSDSEFETFEPVLTARSTRKPASRDNLRSDSEAEAVPAPVQKPKPKRKPTSRETSRSQSKKSKSNPKESFDIFGLLSDEEESIASEHATRGAKEGRQLESSFSSKVANGSVVRRSSLNGRYYVETRVYSAHEAAATPPAQRYTKALVTLKARLDPDQTEWEYLQKYLRKTKILFNDSKPVFYTNK